MTDNEIIKAMKCVIGNDVSCSECEYQKALPFPSCRRMCAKNALDLINRQKEEIKELKDIFEKVPTNAYDLQVEASEKLENRIKSKAIKEFAERVKKELRLDDDCSYDCENCCFECKEFVPQIDNFVKEMTDVEVNQRKEDEGK